MSEFKFIVQDKDDPIPYVITIRAKDESEAFVQMKQGYPNSYYEKL